MSTFDSVATVSWFDGRAKDAHRSALLDAAQLVKRYRIRRTQHFDLTTVDVEFRAAVQPRLVNLLRHVENTAERDIGDAQSLRELDDDLMFVQLLCLGKPSPEVRRSLRTASFDAAVEGLAEMVDNPERFRGSAVAVLKSSTLAERIRWLEETLGWFAERPAPQSTKYSADQARTILALARKALETAREVDKVKSPSATSTGDRPCVRCAKKNDVDAAFCKFCGQALVRRLCAACGTEQDPDAAFCTHCGARKTV